MKRDEKCPLLIKADEVAGHYQYITREDGGWQYLNFAARRLPKDDTWVGNTGNHEYAIVLLGGNYRVNTDKGSWQTINGRRDVFSGMAHTLYLPRHTTFRLTAESDV